LHMQRRTRARRGPRPPAEARGVLARRLEREGLSLRLATATGGCDRCGARVIAD